MNKPFAGASTFSAIVTQAPEMDRMLALAGKAARGAVPVLIEGEVGTGKHLLARSIHLASERAGKPLVQFDCGSLPQARIEAALFGAPDMPGRLQAAQGGTLVISEIGDLPDTAQVRLLEVLLNGELRFAGARRAEKVNVRVIALTSQRLLNLTAAGGFREDLFYRLNLLPITLPPLRQRQGDVALMAGRFAQASAAETGRSIAEVSAEALALLEGYDWPGNVRQLENAVHRAVLLAESASLAPSDFPQLLERAALRSAVAKQALPHAPLPLDRAVTRLADARPDRFTSSDGAVRTLDAVERDLIVFALAHHNRHMSQVARTLGIGRSTLYRKLKQYGLEDGLSEDVG